MEINKETSTIGEILSSAFNLCKTNWIELLKTISVALVPITLVVATMLGTLGLGTVFGVQYLGNSHEFINDFPMVGLIQVILSLIFFSSILALISIYIQGAIIMLLDYARIGKKASWRDAYRTIWRRKWSILGMNLLVWLMGAAFFIAFFMLIAFLIFITFGFGILLIIPLILLVYALVTPIGILFNVNLLVRDLKATEAIGKTFELYFEQGYFWRTIGRTAVIGAIMVAFALAVALLEFIPYIGFVFLMIGSVIIGVYGIAACIFLVVSRDNKIIIMDDKTIQ